MLLVLQQQPTKLQFKKLVTSKILDFWHSKILEDIEQKRSLRFLRGNFLPLGKGPHPLWLSCGDSESAIEAAIINAKILSGRYRDDYLISKWNSNTSGCCMSKNCSFFPGDVTHYLSGNCSALSSQLNLTLTCSLNILSHFPYLVEPVISARRKSAEEWAAFLLNPITNPQLIKISQEFDPTAIWPVFRLTRAYIWTMHRERMNSIE